MNNLLGAIATVSESAYRTIMGFKIAAFILLGVCSLVLVVSVLLQASAENQGTNALTGTSETYYAQNKGGTRDSILKKITIACAVIMFVVSVFLIILLKVQSV